MSADFIRIRCEIDKLNPSFPVALDRAFQLMEQQELPQGGDKHHGLMRSLWPEFKVFKINSWNLVRLPRQIHVEIHVLMAAAFVGTKWFSKFNSARMIAHAISGSKFDSSVWQKRIAEFTKNGKLYVSACTGKYGASSHALCRYAKDRKIATANNSESKVGRWFSKFDSVLWRSRITEFTINGKFFAGECQKKYKTTRGALYRYARKRNIKTASISEAFKVRICL